MEYVTRLQELGCKARSGQVDCNIEALENLIGIPLPIGYRQFLTSCGGWWGDLLCLCQEPTPFGMNHWVNGFYDAREVRDLLHSLITPRNMVTIGSGHLAKYTCVSIAGIDRGYVYAVDGEFRVYWNEEEFHQRFNAMDDSILEYLDLRRRNKLPEKPVGYDSVYLVANDFDEFLSCCRSSV